MLNRGDATFQGPLWFGLANTIAAGDFDGDGRLDLAGAWVNDRNGAWSLTVHRNRPGLCDVQDVLGKTLAVATDLLTRAGCTVGPVRHQRSRARAPRPGRLAVAALPGRRPAGGRQRVARAQPRPALSARSSTRSSGSGAESGSSASTSSRA